MAISLFNGIYSMNTGETTYSSQLRIICNEANSFSSIVGRTFLRAMTFKFTKNMSLATLLLLLYSFFWLIWILIPLSSINLAISYDLIWLSLCFLTKSSSISILMFSSWYGLSFFMSLLTSPSFFTKTDFTIINSSSMKILGL